MLSPARPSTCRRAPGTSASVPWPTFGVTVSRSSAETDGPVAVVPASILRPAAEDAGSNGDATLAASKTCGEEISSSRRRRVSPWPLASRPQSAAQHGANRHLHPQPRPRSSMPLTSRRPEIGLNTTSSPAQSPRSEHRGSRCLTAKLGLFMQSRFRTYVPIL